MNMSSRIAFYSAIVCTIGSLACTLCLLEELQDIFRWRGLMQCKAVGDISAAPYWSDNVETG